MGLVSLAVPTPLFSKRSIAVGLVSLALPSPLFSKRSSYSVISVAFSILKVISSVVLAFALLSPLISKQSIAVMCLADSSFSSILKTISTVVIPSALPTPVTPFSLL